MSMKMFLTEKTIFQNVDYFRNVIRINLRLVHRVLGFFSSRPNWDPPLPRPQSSVSPWFVGDTLACGRGRGVHSSDEGTDNVVLEIYICTLWFSGSKASVFYYINI
jgi:hypothetical protein